MMLDSSLLHVAIFLWLATLFLVAFLAEQASALNRWVQHPLVHALSMGVYATSWSYYGSVGFASRLGYQFLGIYVGATLACLSIPLIWLPLFRLTREHQLRSVADVLAFRYQSRAAGGLVTLFLWLGIIPYIALQIRAVVQSMNLLTPPGANPAPGLGFVLLVVLFLWAFGTRTSSEHESNRGLVFAVAFESVIKLAVLLGIAAYAVWGRFGGPGALSQWLNAHPEATAQLFEPLHDGQWNALVLLGFSAAFLLPRQFHMAFHEVRGPEALRTMTWAFPLFLLLLNVAIPPILWAGQAFLPASASPDQYVLLITTDEGVWLPLIAFLGGVSAASAMLLVTPVALANMALNNLVLPLRLPRAFNIYHWLAWARRGLTALVLLLGYGFYRMLDAQLGLAEIGLISFVAVIQLLPGVLGTLFWPRASRVGFMLGLAGGIGMWALLLIVPLLLQHVAPTLAGVISSHSVAPQLGASLRSSLSAGSTSWLHTLDTLVGRGDYAPWTVATLWTLGLNTLLFVVGSRLSHQTPAEEEVALICAQQGLRTPGGGVPVRSAGEFEALLSPILGPEAARQEVMQALERLALSPDEQRMPALRAMRDQLEHRLAGLLGPLLASMIVRERLNHPPTPEEHRLQTVQWIETQLEGSRLKLRGVAEQLNRLRLYHRGVLDELPVAVCTVDAQRRVVLWNLRFQQLSSLSAEQVQGQTLENLPEPWGPLLHQFAQTAQEHSYKLETRWNGRTFWLNLHKASLDVARRDGSETRTLPPSEEADVETSGTILLVEDLTEQRQLELQLTHTERLASIGRLAAGMGHEIGNPLTGIACIVQNMRAELTDEDTQERLELVQHEIRRIRDILQTVGRFSHRGTAQGTLRIAHFPVSEVIQEAFQLVRLGRAQRNISLESHCPPELMLLGDRPQWVQVLVNLLNNACDASSPGARIEVRAQEHAGKLILEVLDEGSGIAPEVQAHLFEPFVTSKEPGEGTGLGLSIVYHIVREHGGSIGLEPRHGRGTRAVLELPTTTSVPP